MSPPIDPPGDFDAALEAHRAGDLVQAREIYTRIIAADPQHAGAWLNLGALHRQRGDVERALEALKRASSLAPDHPGVQFNLGNALVDAGRIDDAVAAYRETVRLDPNFADAYNNLGDALVRTGQLSAAIEIYRQGLAVAPDHVGLLANLGNALHQTGDRNAAYGHLYRAHRAAPQDTVIRRNFANVLRTAGRLEEAERHFRDILVSAPDDAETHCLLAFTLLARGAYGAGWDAYAWRWRSAEHEPARPFGAPHWQGESLRGKSLLVWGEQAVGDELMFANIFGDLSAMDANVTVETEYRLQPLLARSFPGFRIVTRRTPPDTALTEIPFDFQIAAGDLGRYFRRNSEDFASHSAYLVPAPEKTSAFREAYADKAAGRKRIGVSWRGGSGHAGVLRTVALGDLQPLLTRDDCWFVNLQYGDTAEEEATLRTQGIDLYSDPGVDPLTDMDSAAAQIASLDGVVSIANTTVHMAGALGVPTWVLLSDTPDWRWTNQGDRSPWYRALRLIRKDADGDWTEAVARLSRELDELAT